MDDHLQNLKFSSVTKIWPSQKKQNLLYSLDKCRIPGLYLEFGVYQGSSINIIANHIPLQRIYGFDSFYGLPEGMLGAPAGTFNQNGNLPDVASNVTLVPGLFEDTLPSFTKDTVSFMHIDCDLYSSTKCILDHFKNHIVRGTVIVFDEFQGLPGLEDHEYRAFVEFINETGKDYRVLSMVEDSIQLSIMILN
jgi:predicted O-methyltransferase YrrM